MSIFRVTIPIPDYDLTGIYNQDIFFECEKTPSYDEMIEFLKKLHEEEMKHEEFGDECWNDCLRSIRSIPPADWRYLKDGSGLVGTNTYCKVTTRTGKILSEHSSVTWRKITVHIP